MDEKHTPTPGPDAGGAGPHTDPGTGPGAGPGAGPRTDWQQVRDVRRLSRPTGDRMVGGVASGLARHLDVDPLLLRVAFGVLTFFGGAGVVLYCALWLLMPSDNGERATLQLDSWSLQFAVVGVLGIAALIVLGASWGTWGPPWGVLLVALLVVVFVSRRQSRDDAPLHNQPFPTPAPYGSAAAHGPYAAPNPSAYPAAYPAATPPAYPAQQSTQQATQQQRASGAGWVDDGLTRPLTATDPAFPAAAPLPGSAQDWAAWSGTPQRPAPVRPVRPANPRKRGPVLFWFTLALVALGIGVLATAEVSGVAVVDSAYPALALGIVATMLLVGAFWGRAGGLIALGLVAGLALLGSTVNDNWNSERTVVAPLSADSVPQSHEFGAGELVLDLTGVTDPAELDGRRIVVRGGAGLIELRVPHGVGVDVEAAVTGPGNISDFDRNDRGGIAISQSAGFHSGTDVARIQVDLELSVGEIRLRRAPATTPLDATTPTPTLTPTPTPSQTPAPAPGGDQ